LPLSIAIASRNEPSSESERKIELAVREHRRRCGAERVLRRRELAPPELLALEVVRHEDRTTPKYETTRSPSLAGVGDAGPFTSWKRSSDAGFTVRVQSTLPSARSTHTVGELVLVEARDEHALVREARRGMPGRELRFPAQVLRRIERCGQPRVCRREPRAVRPAELVSRDRGERARPRRESSGRA
jgi:hypothetical protein